jgi:hypothetical protein
MGERVNRDAVGILEEKANGYYKLPARRFKFCDLHSHGNSALYFQACFYRDSWGNSIPASRNRYPCVGSTNRYTKVDPQMTLQEREASKSLRHRGATLVTASWQGSSH